MIIVPLRKELFDYRTGFSIGGNPVGVFKASLLINRKEREKITRTMEVVWKEICKYPGFTGLIRADLVPRFEYETPEVIDWNESQAFDLGEMSVAGVYEINTDSPECLLAFAQLKRYAPELTRFQPNATRLMARALLENFGKDPIYLVFGSENPKQEWGSALAEDLQAAGVNIFSVSPEYCMKHANGSIVWRYGDARSLYPAFSSKFLRFLDAHKGQIFNTLPKYANPGDKSLLMPNGRSDWNSLVGNNFVLKTENVGEAFKRQSGLVLKPFLGCSGQGVVFGSKVSTDRWERHLNRALSRNGHGLYEARWLPKVHLPGFKPFVIDLDPAFWVCGNEASYLYSVARIDTLDNYESRGTINVAQGGAFGGCISYY